MKRIILTSAAFFAFASAGLAQDYPAPVPLAEGAQAAIAAMDTSDGIRIAYMPPATEFAYYIAIGEGIKAAAAANGAEVFMLAPQSGADINGQMGMIQDVITQGVDAIILSTHDEAAAAPLVTRAVEAGIAVVIVNNDIPNFPTPIHAVVGYSQRNGTTAIGQYLVEMAAGAPMVVGVIEGQPGYHSTERVGGFLAGIEGAANITIAASIPGGWNVEGGNTAGMDILTAHPEINVLFAANDYMIMGAGVAAKSMGREVVLLGNDGDTAALEEIAAGTIAATVNTTPFVMGQIALNVTLDTLAGTFPGGFVETPTTIVDSTNILPVLQAPEMLFPQPSKSY
jgi:ribose transport system substrate-binding protein